MRLLSRAVARLAALGTMLFVLGTAGVALAYWTAAGSGIASASVGTLSAPGITAASPGAGTVDLTWSAVASPTGAGAVSYFVTRDGGAPAGTCPALGSPTAGTTCTDSGLTAGIHTYAVTAVWRTWTAMSAATNVTVSFGAATQISLIGSTADLPSGSSRVFTATIQDSAGNTVTSGADASAVVTFAQSGGTGSVSGLGTSTASAGVATITLTGNAAGSVSIRASATLGGTLRTSNTLSLTVTASVGDHFLVVPSTSTPTAGVPFTLTITAQDSANNTATGYTGAQCLTFSGPSASPSGTAPLYPAKGSCASGSAVTFSSGVATGVSITLYRAQTVALTAADNASSKTGSASLTVGAASVGGLTLAGPQTGPAGFSVSCGAVSANDSCTVSGIGVSNSFTSYVAFADAYGNPQIRSGSASSTIALTKGANASDKVTPGTLTVPAGSATTSGAFTFTLGGGSKPHTMTATYGAYTLTMTLS